MRETEVGRVRDDWSIVALGNYSKMDYGTSKKCNPGLNGVPVLRIPNIVRGSLHSVDLSSLDPMLVERNKYLEDGDLLFVRTNATRENIGKTMVYEKQFEKASFASYLIRVKVDKSEFNPTYVHFFSQTEQGIAQLSGRASNAADGKFNINTQTLRTILLPKPSIDVQNQIVIILESIENRIAIEQQYLSSLEDLFSSLLDSLILGKVRVHDLEA
jgi:type I restriction enzyme S subunit